MANLVARLLAGLLLVLRRRHGAQSGRTLGRSRGIHRTLLIAAPSASLIGRYVRPPIAAYVTRYAARPRYCEDRQALRNNPPSKPFRRQSRNAAGRPVGPQPRRSTAGKSDGSGGADSAWAALPTTMGVASDRDFRKRAAPRTRLGK